MAKRKSTGPMFKIGDKVRVKPGVIDPTYPDIPLGGWKGVVVKVMYVARPRYIVQWSLADARQCPCGLSGALRAGQQRLRRHVDETSRFGTGCRSLMAFPELR